MAFNKPRLIYKFEVERKKHIRRFMWMVLALMHPSLHGLL